MNTIEADEYGKAPGTMIASENELRDAGCTGMVRAHTISFMSMNADGHAMYMCSNGGNHIVYRKLITKKVEKEVEKVATIQNGEIVYGEDQGFTADSLEEY